jgi:hypothetical protein
MENPRYGIKSPNIGSYIHFMKAHSIVEKFMGIWPSEKTQIGWVKTDGDIRDILT